MSPRLVLKVAAPVAVGLAIDLALAFFLILRAGDDEPDAGPGFEEAAREAGARGRCGIFAEGS